MKVIDLLNKIAKGEEVPKEVKYKTHYWKYNEFRNDYVDEDEDNVFSCSNYVIVDMLDKEVEIIEEEKELKKIDFKTAETQKEKNRIMKDKINELIDELNKLKKEREEK